VATLRRDAGGFEGVPLAPEPASGQAGGVANWFQRFLRLGERTAGFPPSANGASSFHLQWDLPGAFRSVEVDLEVLVPPAVPQLYFWALQVDFADDSGQHLGGAHLGLQWHPGHPGSTAVNWGGYDRRGSVLAGSESALPSAVGNENTRDFAWRSGVPYRLRVEQGRDPGTWDGVVESNDGTVTTIRTLDVPGSTCARGVTTWSEVFARCDAPGVAVRWSRVRATTMDGATVTPPSCATSFQRHEDGGCANTDSVADEVGVLQMTSTPRTAVPGDRLVVPS